MRIQIYLVLQGWAPVNDDETLWTYGYRPQEVYTIFEAAEKEGVALGHVWHPLTLSCAHCGITQVRVFLGGESPACMGVPDAKAFQDRADLEKLSHRIKKALSGEDGMLWDAKED